MTVLVDKDGGPVALVLPRVSDYFEPEELATLPERIERARDGGAEANLFAAGVLAHTGRLTDVQVAAAAISMLEDLYRAMTGSTRVQIPLASGLQLYLQATAGTLASAARRHGYRLQYVIDNQFPTGALGPAAYFPLWFRAAGFIYVSPHEAGLMAMDHDGIALHQFDEFWPRYEREGREIAVQLYERAEADGQNVVIIDDEPTGDLVVRATRDLPRPGLVHIFRNHPPSIKGVLISAPDPLQTLLRRFYAE